MKNLNSVEIAGMGYDAITEKELKEIEGSSCVKEVKFEGVSEDSNSKWILNEYGVYYISSELGSEGTKKYRNVLVKVRR